MHGFGCTNSLVSGAALGTYDFSNKIIYGTFQVMHCMLATERNALAPTHKRRHPFCYH